jgi:TRAP-type transport system periplasmic protein
MKFAIVTSALLLCGLPAAVSAQPIEIKMATLAPKDSQWCDVLVKMGERWKAISNGNVKLTLYAGGVMGDEPDTVNKLRIKLKSRPWRSPARAWARSKRAWPRYRSP